VPLVAAPTQVSVCPLALRPAAPNRVPAHGVPPARPPPAPGPGCGRIPSRMICSHLPRAPRRLRARGAVRFPRRALRRLRARGAVRSPRRAPLSVCPPALRYSAEPSASAAGGHPPARPPPAPSPGCAAMPSLINCSRRALAPPAPPMTTHPLAPRQLRARGAVRSLADDLLAACAGTSRAADDHPAARPPPAPSPGCAAPADDLLAAEVGHVVRWHLQRRR